MYKFNMQNQLVGQKKKEMIPNDKGHVAESEILDVLKCPTLKRDQYEYEKELDIDIL